MGSAKHTTEQAISAFWTNVQIGAPDDCWLWQGPIFGGGYGQIGTKHQLTRYAHRFSWLLHYGAIPDGLVVAHRCESRYSYDDKTAKRCVNPAHLCLLTNLQNIQDAQRNGKTGRPKGAKDKRPRRPRRKRSA